MKEEMNSKPQFKITDNVVIKRIDNISGEVLEEETYHNLITDAGLGRVADLIADLNDAGFTYIAIGEDNTAPANGDTALGTEQKREAATVSKPTAVQVKYENLFTFASGESFNITEAGLFDQNSGGTMLNRLTFPAKAVDFNTDLSVTITITVSRV